MNARVPRERPSLDTPEGSLSPSARQVRGRTVGGPAAQEGFLTVALERQKKFKPVGAQVVLGKLSRIMTGGTPNLQDAYDRLFWRMKCTLQWWKFYTAPSETAAELLRIRRLMLVLPFDASLDDLRTIYGALGAMPLSTAEFIDLTITSQEMVARHLLFQFFLQVIRLYTKPVSNRFYQDHPLQKQ